MAGYCDSCANDCSFEEQAETNFGKNCDDYTYEDSSDDGCDCCIGGYSK